MVVLDPIGGTVPGYAIYKQFPIKPYWKVSSTNGNIKVASGLDFETANTFFIRFSANDGFKSINSHYEEVLTINNIEELHVDFSSRSSASSDSASDGSLVIDVQATSKDQVPVYFIVSKDGKELYSVENYPTANALGLATLSGLAPGKYTVDVIDKYGYEGLKTGAYSVYDHGYLERTERVDSDGYVKDLKAKYLKDAPLFVCYK